MNEPYDGTNRPRRTPQNQNGNPPGRARNPAGGTRSAANRNPQTERPEGGVRSAQPVRNRSGARGANGQNRYAAGRGRTPASGTPTGGGQKMVPSSGGAVTAGVRTGIRRPDREQRKIERYERYSDRNMTRWQEQERRENAWQRGIIRVKSSADRPLLILAVVLLALGTITVLSASYPLAVRKGREALYFAKRQGLFLLLGMIMAAIGWKLPYEHRVMRRLIPLGVWLFAAGCLVAVNFIGVSEGEAQRWIQIPGVPVTIQPSEIMKIGEVMLLAMYADLMKKRMSDAGSLGSQYLYNVVLPGALVGVSCGLVIVGKHLSGTMIIGIIGLFMVLVMVDRKCRSWWAPVTILVLLTVAAAAYIIAVPYARDRFIGIFSPEADRWQSMQSLYAVGSGGLFGVGVGQSRQKYSYLGAAHTDFIFAIWCEEFGFVGALALIALFLAFLWRAFRIASRAKDPFSMLTAYGIAVHFAVQMIGHMVVDTTFMNTGISLPFFSYGGSSLLVQMYEVGLLLRISEHDYRSRAELEEAEMRRRVGLD